MHATIYIAVHLLPHAGKDGDQDVKSMLKSFYEVMNGHLHVEVVEGG